MRTIPVSFCAAAVAVLGGCSDPGLRKHDDGWISYERAPSVSSGRGMTRGRFVRENGCTIFRSRAGQRLLLLMPKGQRISVEPERVLFAHEWGAFGLDASSPAVEALRDDPVAVGCGARPAFVSHIGPPDPPPPPPGPKVD